MPVAITLNSGQSLPRRENGKEFYDISPDGREIAFVANSDTSGRDENTDVYVVPASGGAAKNLTVDNPAADEGPSYSPDGRYLAYSKQTIKGFYGDTKQLWLVDRKSDARRRVAADWDRSVSGITWAPDSKSLYAPVDDAATNASTACRRKGAQLLRRARFQFVALAGKPETLVARRQSFTEPPTLALSRSRTAAQQASHQTIAARRDSLRGSGA